MFTTATEGNMTATASKPQGQYPDTAEKRRAGMAHVRAQMLAAHKRQLPKHSGAVAAQLRDMIRTIEATQARNAEVQP